MTFRFAMALTRVSGLTCLALALTCSLAVAKEASPVSAEGGAQLARLLAACAANQVPRMPFCAAAEGFDLAHATPLSEGDHVLLGLTFEPAPHLSVEQSLAQTGRLSTMVLRNQQGKLSGDSSDLNPESASEKVVTDQVRARLSLVLGGSADTVQLPAVLWKYLSNFADQHPMAPFAKSERGWQITGRARGELRQVDLPGSKIGHVWVAVETPVDRDTPVWISVYVDRLSSEVESATPARPSGVEELLWALNVAAKCRSSHLGADDYPWCLVAHLYAMGTAGEISPGRHSLLGITLVVDRGRPVSAALAHGHAVGALLLNNDKGKITAGMFRVPEEGDPVFLDMVLKAGTALRMCFRDGADRVTIGDPIAEFMSERFKRARNPVTRDTTGWRLGGDFRGELRKLGALWIAIGTPASQPELTLISIFTENLNVVPWKSLF